MKINQLKTYPKEGTRKIEEFYLYYPNTITYNCTENDLYSISSPFYTLDPTLLTLHQEF